MENDLRGQTALWCGCKRGARCQAKQFNSVLSQKNSDPKTGFCCLSDLTPNFFLALVYLCLFPSISRYQGYHCPDHSQSCNAHCLLLFYCLSPCPEPLWFASWTTLQILESCIWQGVAEAGNRSKYPNESHFLSQTVEQTLAWGSKIPHFTFQSF